MKNEIYVLTDDGEDYYKCECGQAMTSIYSARNHERSGCQEPKTWSPPIGHSAEPTFELDVFKKELADALCAAKEEGAALGYNDGLGAAYQLVTEVKARAERAGQSGVANLLEALKGQLDTLVLDAHERLSPDDRKAW